MIADLQSQLSWAEIQFFLCVNCSFFTALQFWSSYSSSSILRCCIVFWTSGCLEMRLSISSMTLSSASLACSRDLPFITMFQIVFLFPFCSTYISSSSVTSGTSLAFSLSFFSLRFSSRRFLFLCLASFCSCFFASICSEEWLDEIVEDAFLLASFQASSWYCEKSSNPPY